MSLNIPDTSDVKETFGSVINTVVEQHEELQELHTNVDSNATETVEGQRKLLAWTASCLQKLKAENERLQTKLGDSNKQLKNLSYNMQGFVDQDAANDAEAEEEPLEFDEMPKFNHSKAVSDVETSSLFPTEEGADMSGGAMSLAAPEIRKFTKYKDLEAKQRAKEYYQSVPANTMPRNAKARWRWAIKKIVNNEHRKHLKVGLTRARVEPKQTYAGRLDRVEAIMFDMKNDFKDQLVDLNKKLNHKIDTSMERIDREVSKAAEKVDELTEDVKHRFSDLKEEISMVDASMRDFMAKVHQQASGDTKYLKEAMRVVELHIKDQVHLELESLQSHVNHITTELDQYEESADDLLQRVEAQYTLSATLPPFDPAKPVDETVAELTDLMQIDTTLREARSELALMEAGIATIFRLYQNVSQQVCSATQHYSKESVKTAAIEMISTSQREELSELSQRCVGVDGHIKHISSLFAALDKMCHEHDKILKDRLRVFNGLSKDVSGLASSTAQISAIVEDLKHQTSRPSTSNTGAGLNPRQLELMMKLAGEVTDLTRRVTAMELAGVDLDFGDGDDGEGSFGAPEEQEQPEVEDEGLVIIPVFEPVLPSKSTKMAEPEIDEEKAGNNLAATEVLCEKTTVALSLNESQVSVKESVKVDVIEKLAEATSIIESAPVDSQASKTPALRHAATLSSISPADLPAAARKLKAAPRVSGATAGGGASAREGSEKRKASSAANLDVLEARLRPLIEKLVAAGIEERMQDMGNFDFEGDDEEEDGELGDEQLAIRASSPLAAVPEVAAEGDETPAVAPARTPAGMEPPAESPLSIQAAVAAPVTSGIESGGIPSPGSDGPHSLNPASRSRSTYVRQSSIEGMPPPRDPRIRREASRFGGMSGSSKSNKMSRSMDLSPYIEELAQLKRENSRLNKAMRQMEEERLTKDDIERMVNRLIHAHHHNEQKEESNHAIHSLERRIDLLVKDICNFDNNNTKAISGLRAEFTDTLYKVINSAAESLDAENKESFVNTRALCLGCGRSSLVRAQPESRPTSPSFFPQLSAGSLAGPDVLRGGFKLPVKNPLNPLYVLEGAALAANRTRSTRSAGLRMHDALVSNSLDSPSLQQQGSIGSDVGGHQSSLEVEAVLPRVKSAQPRPNSHHMPREGSGMEFDDQEDDIRDEELQEWQRQQQHSSAMNITGGALEEPSRVTMGGDGSMIIQANKGYQLNIASSKSTWIPSFFSSSHLRINILLFDANVYFIYSIKPLI